MADMTASSFLQERLISYVKTKKGLILAAEVLLGLPVLICYALALSGWMVMAIGAMTFSTVFFGIFMMDLDKQLQWVHWLWTDFIRAAVVTAFYLVVSLFMAFHHASYDSASLAGGAFGLIAGLVYAYDTYTIVLQLKSSREQNEYVDF